MPHLSYPPAPKGTQTDTYHGVAIADPHRELENADSTATRQWVDHENELTRSYLDKVPGRDAIRKSLTELWNYEKFRGLTHWGNRYFSPQHRTSKSVRGLHDGQARGGRKNRGRPQYVPRRWHRRPEWIPTELGRRPVRLWGGPGGLRLDRVAGARCDDRGRPHRPDSLDQGDQVTWTADNKAFYYSRFPEPLRPKSSLTAAALHSKVYFHKLGDPQSADTLIYERPEHPNWTISPNVLEGGRYLMLLSTRVRDEPALLPRPSRIAAEDHRPDHKEEYIYNPLGAVGSVLYLQTTDHAPRGRVIAIDLARPDRASWKEIVPEQAETLEDVHIANGKMLLGYMKDAHSVARLVTMDGKPSGEVQMPGIGRRHGRRTRRRTESCSLGIKASPRRPANIGSTSPRVRRRWSSNPKWRWMPPPTRPKQVFYPSKDGTKIPMFLVAQEGPEARRHATRRCSTPTAASTSSSRRRSARRGSRCSSRASSTPSPTCAAAASTARRGTRQGMKLKKQNVFDDFIAAAEWLIAQVHVDANARHPGRLERRPADRAR